MNDNVGFQTVMSIPAFSIAESIGMVLLRICFAEWLAGGVAPVLAFPADIPIQPNELDFVSEDLRASSRIELLETDRLGSRTSEGYLPVRTDQRNIRQAKKASYIARKPRATLYI